MKHVFALAAGLFALGAMASSAHGASKPRYLTLFDFESAGGGLNLGREFPGAKGEFAISSDAAHDGKRGGRISFDLTRGAYVAWVYNLPRPLVKGARTISVWVRSSTPGHKIHCKTRDATGQEHVRFAAAPPAGQWGLVTFQLAVINGHWGGANDGKIHWPITLVQIGVEARGKKKVGHIDIDTVSVSTVAPVDAQPGAALSLEAPRFGNLFEAGSSPVFVLGIRGMERRPPQSFAGAYSLRDWQDREVARGRIDALQVLTNRDVTCQLSPTVPGFGAFGLEVCLRNAANPSEELRAQAWFGVLSGPTPRPCPWTGTGIHAGHGWGRGDLRFLDILTAAGIGVVREELGWAGVERSKGKYAVSARVEAFVDALVERGIRLNLLLTYGNGIYENPLNPDAYARWAAWMAKHFDGRVRDFEIWNEPANFSFKNYYGGERYGNAPWIAKFVELSRKAGTAIRKVRPDANIILCAEDCWPTLKQMIEEGIGPAGNVISIHPYCHGQPRPEREFFLRDLGKELRRVSREHGGPQRVVITEAGWTTYQGNMAYLAIAGGYPRCSYVHQAQYIVRMFLTAQAAGADYAIQYDFKNDGNRRDYTEHNFGLVHEDYSPKPSLMAVAAMTRLLGQGRFVSDVSPDPERARAYVFDVRGKPVVAAYAIEGSAGIDLEVGAPQLQLADLMGNRRVLAAPHGVAKLSLSETPIYLIGADRKAVLRFARVEIKPADLTIAVGDTASAAIHCENRMGRRLRPEVRCLAPDGVEAGVRWNTTDGSTPAIPDEGTAEGQIHIGGSGQTEEPVEVVVQALLGERSITRRMRVWMVEPVSARFGAARRDGKGWRVPLRLTSRSNRRRRVRVALDAPSGVLERSQPVAADLGAGESREYSFAIAQVPKGTLKLTASMSTPDGWRGAHTDVLLPSIIARLTKAPAIDGNLDDWPDATRFRLSEPEQFAAIRGQTPWKGPNDLAATVRLAWCPKGICVGVETTDDVFHQPHANDEIWRGDSIQLAIAPVVGGPRRLEIGLARTPRGDRCFVYSPLTSKDTQKQYPIQLAISKGDSPGGLSYEALIPWQRIPGLNPESGTRLGLSLLVNENDGAGRRGWLHAFEGIGWRKDPALYGELLLE